MKKLLLSISLILLSFKGISQTATDTLNKAPVGIPQYQLTEAAKDLEKGDACEEELKLANENTAYWEKAYNASDSINKIHLANEMYYKNSIGSLQEVGSMNKEYIKDLKKENNFLRVKTTFLTIMVVAIPTFIYIFK